MWNRLIQAVAITVTLSFVASGSPNFALSIATSPRPFSLGIRDLKLPFKPAWLDLVQPAAATVQR